MVKYSLTCSLTLANPSDRYFQISGSDPGWWSVDLLLTYEVMYVIIVNRATGSGSYFLLICFQYSTSFVSVLLEIFVFSTLDSYIRKGNLTFLTFTVKSSKVQF